MNKFTFKLIAAMLCICMLLPVFTACGNNDDPTDTPTQAPTEVITDAPTDAPTDKPTDAPTEQPTDAECTHSEKETIAAVAATCTESGATAGEKCVLCGTTLVEPQTVEALGHSPSVLPEVLPTCTEKGRTIGKQCSVCEVIIEPQNTVDALGHTYTDSVDDTCDRCGMQRQVYDMFQYYSEIQYISGTGINGTSTSYGIISHRDLLGVYPEVSGVTTLENGYLGLSGVMIVASQDFDKFIWSFDGETWNDCTGGTFAMCTLTQFNNAKKYGDFKNPDRSKKSQFKGINIDLREFNEQTVEQVYVAAKIVGTDIIIPVCKVKDIYVEYIQLPGADMTSYGGYIRHAFDAFSVADEPVSLTKDKHDVFCGEIIRLRGWVGFDQPIVNIGYCIGDNGRIVYNRDFIVDAEAAVKNEGGEHARRFNINIDSTSIPNGRQRIYFIAELADGNIIVIFRSVFNVSGGFDDDGQPDTEVIKAAPDRSAPTNTNATLSGSTVNTGMGASYTFSGGSFSGNRFAFGGGTSHTVSFTGNTATKLSGEFNRFKIRYVSTGPVKATVTYTENGKSVKDVVYLDAAPNGSTFTCLTLKYLESVNATDLSKIEFVSANGQNISFLLCNVETEVYTVYNNNIKFIQNSKFRLGIKLAWGGGICYIEDRQDGISDLSNLVNQHDTGRLIQQSYYGTNGYSDDYVMGNYNGTPWKYNPVQGGDLYGNHSRIVDVVVEKYSIYIKAQPQDWGHNGKITPSYMENIYTIYPDIIDVWNRLVDYSNYNHVSASQELPAFYTVGYLDTFYHAVDGNPWATPNRQPNLAFWGRRDDKRFTCSYSKTKQTWSAFTNADGTFGLGLYTPNSASILAGRFGYDNDPLNHQAAEGTAVIGYGPTKDSMSAGCSYIAPVNKFRLVCYKPVEYSYIMTTGSIDQIRTTFQRHSGFADNAAVEHEGW